VPQTETFRVLGYRDFMRACARADKDTRRYVRSTLRETGELVRSDAVARFSTIDARSAAGYKIRVRQTGVLVEQSLRKTTGRRPDYGALQMRRALLPALAANQQDTERRLEHAIDEIADRFERV